MYNNIGQWYCTTENSLFYVHFADEINLRRRLILYRFTVINYTWTLITVTAADPGGRAVKGVGLRPLACWACEFESRKGLACLSCVNVVCCQVEASTTAYPALRGVILSVVCLNEYDQVQQ
jgi:hypothetical protein